MATAKLLHRACKVRWTTDEQLAKHHVTDCKSQTAAQSTRPENKENQRVLHEYMNVDSSCLHNTS